MRLLACILAALSLWLAWAAPTEAKKGQRGSKVKEKMREDMDKIRFQPGKHFHESNFHHHYDGRFSDHALPEGDRQQALKVLIQTYLATFRDLGVETWIMHGSLMGWWWNKQSLPWDDDADVMILEPSIHYLAAYHNMSTHHFQYDAAPEGRSFLLEINPSYTTRDESDHLNVVDARWIDMDTGLFIDITTARYALDHPRGDGVLFCKDGHEFRDTYVFPLLDTTFEGVPAKIPFKYREFLAAEYGAKSLYNKNFHEHNFDDETMEWIPLDVDSAEL